MKSEREKEAKRRKKKKGALSLALRPPPWFIPTQRPCALTAVFTGDVCSPCAALPLSTTTVAPSVVFHPTYASPPPCLRNQSSGPLIGAPGATAQTFRTNTAPPSRLQICQ
ncbi:hypothetical protein U1Q18_039723 [Sarracenia purpurea var. burkii]